MSKSPHSLPAMGEAGYVQYIQEVLMVQGSYLQIKVQSILCKPTKPQSAWCLELMYSNDNKRQGEWLKKYWNSKNHQPCSEIQGVTLKLVNV